MLVINRNVEQSVIIRQKDKPDIVVTVLEVAGRSARLGIQADADVTLLREEILPRINEVS